MAERKHFTDEEIAKADSVDIIDLAKRLGYDLKKGDSGSMKANGEGGLYFYPDGNRYWRFGSGEKGGAISLVEMRTGRSFPEAVKYLLGDSEAYVTPSSSQSSYHKEPKVKADLVLPDKAPNIKRAYWYLLGHRKLDSKIVSDLIQEKKIFQDARGNAVFVGYDKDGTTPKYCNKRGTYVENPYKKDQLGSDKSYPFHIAGTGDKVVVCESPIDAIAHATLYKRFGLEPYAQHHISLGCLSDKALEKFLSWHPEIQRIVFAYDNDVNGQITKKDGSIEKHNWGQEAAVAAAKKYKELGYKVSIKTPAMKDFSEDLIMYTKQSEPHPRESETEAQLTGLNDKTNFIRDRYGSDGVIDPIDGTATNLPSREATDDIRELVYEEEYELEMEI
ncbi:MAG: DUF3991 and toprim domain-containing protein [Clostridiales Family XIII bacterium]|jgi:hypothetical protein|nr:DUF3991 and toprim domain-containing protein [Clostridiales Family XIII bacterium]